MLGNLSGLSKTKTIKRSPSTDYICLPTYITMVTKVFLVLTMSGIILFIISFSSNKDSMKQVLEFAQCFRRGNGVKEKVSSHLVDMTPKAMF